MHAFGGLLKFEFDPGEIGCVNGLPIQQDNYFTAQAPILAEKTVSFRHCLKIVKAHVVFG